MKKLVLILTITLPLSFANATPSDEEVIAKGIEMKKQGWQTIVSAIKRLPNEHSTIVCEHTTIRDLNEITLEQPSKITDLIIPDNKFKILFEEFQKEFPLDIDYEYSTDDYQAEAELFFAEPNLLIGYCPDQNFRKKLDLILDRIEFLLESN